MGLVQALHERQQIASFSSHIGPGGLQVTRKTSAVFMLTVHLRALPYPRSLARCFLGCSSLFVLCFSQWELGSAPPVRCDSKERRLISTRGLQNECHCIAATPCNSPQATSLCVSPAVPRTIHGRTLTGRAIMVTDVLAIWNGYSCQDLRRLTVLRNRFFFFLSNGSTNQEG